MNISKVPGSSGLMVLVKCPSAFGPWPRNQNATSDRKLQDRLRKTSRLGSDRVIASGLAAGFGQLLI